MIVDWVWIAVKNESQIDLVYDELKKWTDMKVFKKDEIPEFFHIKNADYALDLLIVPKFINVSYGFDNDHPTLYLPNAAGNETEEYQSQGEIVILNTG